MFAKNLPVDLRYVPSDIIRGSPRLKEPENNLRFKWPTNATKKYPFFINKKHICKSGAKRPNLLVKSIPQRPQIIGSWVLPTHGKSKSTLVTGHGVERKSRAEWVWGGTVLFQVWGLFFVWFLWKIWQSCTWKIWIDLGCLSAVRGFTNGDLLEIQMVEHSEAMLGSKYGLRNRGVAFSWEKNTQPLTWLWRWRLNWGYPSLSHSQWCSCGVTTKIAKEVSNEKKKQLFRSCHTGSWIGTPIVDHNDLLKKRSRTSRPRQSGSFSLFGWIKTILHVYRPPGNMWMLS